MMGVVYENDGYKYYWSNCLRIYFYRLQNAGFTKKLISTKLCILNNLKNLTIYLALNNEA